MTSIPLTLVDLVILGILLLSGIWAAYKGFLREVLSIAAWLGAAIACVLFGGQFVPFARQYVDHDLLAMGAAYAGTFLAVLLPLAYISYRLSEAARGLGVGWFDRLLGFGFGIARGLVVVAVAYLIFAGMVTDESRHPAWLKEARTLPLVKSTSDLLMAAVPDKYKPKPVADEPAARPARAPAASETAGAKPKPEAKPAAEAARPAARPASAESAAEIDRRALEEKLEGIQNTPTRDAPSTGATGGQR